MFVRLHLNRNVVNNPTLCQKLVELVACGLMLRGEEGDVCLETREGCLSNEVNSLPIERVSILENIELSLQPGRHIDPTTGATGRVETLNRRGSFDQRIEVFGPTYEAAIALYSSIRGMRPPEEPWVNPIEISRRTIGVAR